MGIFLKDLDKHYTYDHINDVWNRTGIRVQKIKAIEQQNGTRTGTTQTINIPNSSISAGNIICIAFTIRFNPGGGGSDMSASGYVVGNSGSDLIIPGSFDDGVKTQNFYRVADGTEGSTLSITHNTTAASSIQNLWFSTVYILDIGDYDVNYSGSGTNISSDGISCINFAFGHGGLQAGTISSAPYIGNGEFEDDLYTENGNLIYWSSLFPSISTTLFSYYFYINPKKQPSPNFSSPTPEILGGNAQYSYGTIYEGTLYAT